MRETYPGIKLCLFIGEDDRVDHRPLYEVLLDRALECGLSGGTVIRGREGFGAHGEIHTKSILRLAENLPLVLEFIGRREKIEAYLTRIEPLIHEGMATQTDVTVTKFRQE